jgi:uncharacterized SAM-binding protein YcdF (DUF218 family)
MFLLKKILAALILPPTGPLLLAAIGLWLSRHRPRFGHILIALGLGTLLLLSTPWIANELLRSLQNTLPPAPEQLANTQAIVILGGGTYRNAPEYGGDTVNEVQLERLRYGAHLARQTGLPVGVAGGAPMGGTAEAESMREVMETEFRVAVRWIETSSLDTGENAAYMAPILKQSGVSQIVLVTHAWHMRRAQHAFERQGLKVIPAATRYAPPFRGDLLQWIPSGGALRNSQIALHEWLGLLANQLADATAQ